jgi:hypothetical protein
MSFHSTGGGTLARVNVVRDEHKTAKQLCNEFPLMIESAKLDRLLTQVNCRITSIARLRHAGAISNRKAEQELKQAVKFRVELMRQVDGQNFVFDA